MIGVEENAYDILGLEQGPASTEADIKKVGTLEVSLPLVRAIKLNRVLSISGLPQARLGQAS